MGDLFNLKETKLSDAERKALELFCWEVKEAIGENLLSVTLYGSAAGEEFSPGRSDINILLLTGTMEFQTLEKLLDPVSVGLRVSIHPMLLTEANLKSSTDIFPVKFYFMKKRYRVLYGKDLLHDLEILPEHLRLKSEQEIMNLLLRLRRHFVYHGGWRLAQKITSTITPFVENLRVAMSLGQEGIMGKDEAIEAAQAHGISASAIRAAIGLKESGSSREEVEKIYADYMEAVESAAKMVDARHV
ncbi:MAG: hypothetical protein OEZ04_10595 [Nitrospinota bacterium]|nr:hypothetical protein [Nitrospinota bacterium]